MNPTKFTVLHLEDNLGDIELFQSSISHFTHVEYVYLLDGRSGLDWLQNPENVNTLRLIVLDINIPKVSGLEVLKYIKNEASGIAHIPTIVLSTSENETDIMQSYRQCANGYMVKSPDVMKYFEKVRKTLDYWLDTVSFA